MKEAFFSLAARLAASLAEDEVLLCNLSAERSDFVRFNHARVRQAGSVEQRYLTVRLVRGRRHASATVSLAGDGDDVARAGAALGAVRDSLEGLPDDPWLLYNEAPESTDTVRRGQLLSGEELVDEVVAQARGRDLVGIYAAGTIYRGFANSLGQRNWHEMDSFNLDWSLYREDAPLGDQAVKAGYAGFAWEPGEFAARMEAAAGQLALLGIARRDIPAGEHRAFLAPRALEELIGLLSWGGFSVRARQTRQSPLLRMQAGQTLSPRVTIAENTAEGIAHGFQADGFIKPARVALIRDGRLGDPLVSPRSAQEYGLATNAANADEAPGSVDMAAGSLDEERILRELGRGLYVSNLWYLNFSDRSACRLTGMTRFASFWVEDGRIRAPLNVMRFDDTAYRILGDNLEALTRERDLVPDDNTYGERSTVSMRTPGALVRDFALTL